MGNIVEASKNSSLRRLVTLHIVERKHLTGVRKILFPPESKTNATSQVGQWRIRRHRSRPAGACKILFEEERIRP
jgi:hypothetical protein